MSFGGGSNKPQVQNTFQTFTPPAYVKQAQEEMLANSKRILDPYLNAGTSGYGVAGFNADQNAAFQGVRDLAGSHGLDPASIQKFLNPYTQNVVDTTNKTLRDQNDVTLNQIRGRTAAGSSFGGSNSRGALMESEANRNLGNTMAAKTAELMAQGYDKATATAITSQGLQQQQLQALLGIGNEQQKLEQTKLDVPLNALQRQAALTPQNYGGTTVGQTTTTGGQQQQSDLQQGLGALLSLGGLRGAGGASIASNLFGSLFGISDRTMKTDIQKLGKDEATGIPLYAYRYKGDKKNTPKVVGPMAQDVQKKFPEAVRRIGGKLAVASPMLALLSKGVK